MPGIILYKNYESYHQWCKFFQFLSQYMYIIGCVLHPLVATVIQKLILAQGLNCEMHQ